MWRGIVVLGLASCRLGFEPITGDGSSSTSVTVAITGAGTISDPSNGITCSSRCTTPVAPGTVLRLVATPAPGAWFRGWTSTCAGRHACDVSVGDQPIVVTADFTPEPNFVFVSSAPHDGNFGSLAAADGWCATLATQAGLGGTFVALLSTTDVSFGSRLAGARGWIRPDGEPVGDEAIELIGPRVRASITLTETGADLAASFWAPSAVPGEGCTEWTSTTGTARTITTERGANYQSGGASSSCASLQHVLCAGVDRVQQVDPVPEVGRRAFTSVTTWSAATGIAAADATCAADAAAAGLPGTYRALLATTGTTALSRFALDGPTWIRTDGTRLLPTAQDWLTASRLDVSLNLGPAGETFDANFIALGATGPAAPGTDSTSCTSWTGAGTLGCPLITWETTLGGPCVTSCDATLRLLCLQE